MAAELAARGLPCSENRCARLMRERGINARGKAAFRPKTTIADHMRASLATGAFAAAAAAVPPAPGAISHSDRGSQYTSGAMRGHLSVLGFAQSMSAQGYCYDNAKAESFFATLKREAFPDGCCFDTKDGARLAIFDYLETFYNRRRRHSSLGNISPDEFLDRHFTNTKPNLN